MGQSRNKGSLDLLTVDGKVYGLPVSTEGLGLVVNKKIFDDAGIDISNLKSMKDFDDAFSKLDAKIKDGSLANVDSCKNLKAVTAVQVQKHGFLVTTQKIFSSLLNLKATHSRHIIQRQSK